MLVNPFKILKHVIKSAFKRLNSSDSKPTMDKRFLYVKHFKLGNFLVKARCTDSTRLIIPTEEGDQTGVQYSSKVQYVISYHLI